MKNTLNQDFLRRSIIILVSFFIVFFLIGLFIVMLGIKLSFNFGIILFYLLFIIIIFDHLTYLFTSSYSLLLKILGIVGLIITSLYIIYDTNKILQDNYDGDFITASLNYYIDIFYYADFLTVGIRYLLYILNLFTAFVGINHIKKT